MIWLSAMAGTGERSVYFDVRDIDLRQTGNETKGRVGGILGDGLCECWGEVSLGQSPQVDLLPFYEEGEKVIDLDASVDISSLKIQLAEAVTELLSGVQKLTIGGRLTPHFSRSFRGGAEADSPRAEAG